MVLERTDDHVGIVGLGRFGRVLSELTHAAGLDVTGCDPAVGGSLDEVCRNAGLVILAVPLEALHDVTLELRPRLSPHQLVLDVCSVKQRAEATLTATLGTEGAWVGTHPLFGPSSHDEPRRAIVCERPRAALAVARARTYYERIGCQVSVLTAEAHDRLMAHSQALAALLGGALRALGLEQGNEAYPPSVAPLQQLARAQNAQPGHLRDTLLHANPQAPAVRARLFAALVSLDAAPVRHETPVAPAAALAALRDGIDALDRGIIDLLARRAEIARAISSHKAALGRPVHDPIREATAFGDRRKWADQIGLDPNFIESLFSQVLLWSRTLQAEQRRERE